MAAYVVNPGFPRGKADRASSYRRPILRASKAVRSVDNRIGRVTVPDPVSAAVKPSADLDDFGSIRPSDAVERTGTLVWRQPNIDPSDTSRSVSWELAGAAPISTGHVCRK